MRFKPRPDQLAPGAGGMIVEIIDPTIPGDDVESDSQPVVFVDERYAPGPRPVETEKLRADLAQMGLTLTID